jgi:lambda family phage minor tail protein L
MNTAPRVIEEQLQSLEPSAIIELFQLHLTEAVNGIDDVLYFHAGTNEFFTDITFNAVSYTAIPCESEGFDKSTKGTLPRPSFTVANTNNGISSLVVLYSLLNAKLVRIRTCRKFLDGSNFTGGNATADPSAVFDPDGAGGSADIWYVDRISSENPQAVSFELIGRLDLTNLRLPRRQVVEHCPWEYRGTQCGYAGKKYFDVNDTETSEANDVCGHRYNSCALRFPGKAKDKIPFGGFPSARLQV